MIDYSLKNYISVACDLSSFTNKFVCLVKRISVKLDS